MVKYFIYLAALLLYVQEVFTLFYIVIYYVKWVNSIRNNVYSYRILYFFKTCT